MKRRIDGLETRVDQGNEISDQNSISSYSFDLELPCMYSICNYVSAQLQIRKDYTKDTKTHDKSLFVENNSIVVISM